MNEKIAFLPAFIQSYFIAAGVLLGGAMIGALGAFLSGEQPLTAMYRFAGDLRIWAVVAAIGGTFDTFYMVERGLFFGETRDIVRQFLLILSAMGGAQTGVTIITWLTQEHISS
ncbi:YtrH family sporulation protein [Parageobacillus sp. VR-IP]|uniref:YtrH family sporulation protein n=1 Tax=Parageobacillus sp. VR-IP TaxID=2742205 RepID=UPI001581D83E|nr:YtrH family sporulation protein [Parageobacillus sp. VR-IP]NUK30650.1 YtrH family sporulation protein [Parageobacillus sp. VR-IP]